MAIITIPTIRSAGSNMKLLRGDSVLEHFSGSVDIVAPPKALWILTFPLVTQRLATARAWQAALVQLSTYVNQFKAIDPSWFNGVAFSGTNPTVSGASQLGTSLTTIGGSSGAIALAGDYFEVNGELKMLTSDANGPGPTINFEPALRQSPANGAPIEFKIPKGTFRLATPTAEWAASLPDFIGITITAVEHF